MEHAPDTAYDNQVTTKPNLHTGFKTKHHSTGITAN